MSSNIGTERRRTLRRPTRAGVLPLNIYANIIREFALNSPESTKGQLGARRICLKNLSLTCRSLRPLCQRHLFHTISIRLRKLRKQDPCEGKKRLQDFVALTENGTIQLATYIQDLQLTLYLVQPLENESAALASQFLSRLHKIEAFSLNGSSKSMNWRSLNPILAGNLADIIQSPHLQLLALKALKNFPFYALKKASQLSGLSINHVTAGEGPEVHQADQTDQRSNGPLLSSVSNYKNKSRSSAAAPASVEEPDGPSQELYFSHLKHISFVWDFKNGIDGIEELMRSVLKLESLAITVKHDTHFTFKGLGKMILHGSFSTLRNLEITITRREPCETDDPFGNIHKELKQLSTKSGCLESIALNLNLQGLWTEFGDIKNGCDSIDRLFVSKNPFPLLRTFAIIVRFHYDTDGDEETDEMVEDQFYDEVDYMRKVRFRNISAMSTINFSFIRYKAYLDLV